MNDLRYAIRQLLKNPGFTAVAVLTLALGIGATSSVFSLIQGVLLTPPAYAGPDQVVLIWPSRLDGQPFSQGCTGGQWFVDKRVAVVVYRREGAVYTLGPCRRIRRIRTAGRLYG